MGAKENSLPLEYQQKLKAKEPNNYKGKVSKETEDIIKKEKNRNSLEHNTVYLRIVYVLI